MENNNTNTNDNHLSTIYRDERHPFMEPTSIPGIDNTTLHNIINSIIQSNKTNQSTDINTSGSTHVLLPVDLLVSIDNKSNIPTVQAALPSSFAIQQPLSLIQSPFPSIPNISVPNIPFQMNTNYNITNTTNNIQNNIMINQSNSNSNKSSLNPSAPSFTPSYPSYTMQPMQPIAEVNNEINQINQIINNDNIKDQWCIYDNNNNDNHTQISTQKHTKAETHLHSPKFKTNKRFYNHNKDKRSYNKSWRNHGNNNDNMHANARWRNNRFNNRIIKLLAVFIKHVTLPNRHQYPPDTLLTKTWAMKNCGETEWGYNVELVYCKGDEHLSLHNRYPVKNAKCGEEIEISANIKTPKESGRYCTYFRLQKNGKFFGPRVWVDIIVKSLDEMDKNITNNCGKQNNENINNNNDVSNVVLSKKTIKWKKRKFGNAHNHYKVVACK